MLRPRSVFFFPRAACAGGNDKKRYELLVHTVPPLPYPHGSLFHCTLRDNKGHARSLSLSLSLFLAHIHTLPLTRSLADLHHLLPLFFFSKCYVQQKIYKQLDMEDGDSIDAMMEQLGGC